MIPRMVASGQRVFAYPFEGYWVDVGTIEAYYEANMDLRRVSPALNLYNRKWPLRSASYSDPPAKFTWLPAGSRREHPARGLPFRARPREGVPTCEWEC